MVHDDIRDQIDVQLTLRPTHLLRSIQLIIYTWFTSRKSNVQPATPDFADVLIRIQLSSYQLPGLPGMYHDLTYAIKPQLSISTPTSGGTTMSDLSTIMGLSRRPQGVLPQVDAVPKHRNVFVRNAEPDTALQALVPAHIQLRNIIKNDQVPLNDSQQPMCLSFHLRRSCWSQ
jgi:hypothetical protein